MFHSTVTIVAVAGLLLAGDRGLAASSAGTEPGVTEQEIRIGSSGALSGPIGNYGTDVATGGKIYFAKINDAGGIHGRKIQFDNRDDGYEPARMMGNVRSLVEEGKVFALVGGNGTSGINAILPYLKNAGIPLFFPYTGGFSTGPGAFSLRISYEEEARSLISHAVGTLRFRKIGIFFQDDAFGLSGRTGAARALAERELEVQGEGIYPRNSEEVKDAVQALKKAKPQAVFLQAVKEPAFAFIREAARNGFKPVYLCTSIIGALEISKAIRDLDVEIYASEVLPLPTDERFAIAREFRAEMSAAGKTNLTSAAFEGYVGAAVFAAAVSDAGRELTRVGLTRAMEGIKRDFGGVRIEFSRERHVGLRGNQIYRVVKGVIAEVRDGGRGGS